MNIDQLYPGRFIKAGTLGGKHVTVTIDRVFHEMLGQRKNAAGKVIVQGERKVIMTFAGKEMGLVLAKINAASIAAMFGNDASAWTGKRIVLYATNKIMPFPRARGDNRPPDECIRIYGSPDIERAVRFEFRKAIGSIWIELKPTGQRQPTQPQQEPQPQQDGEKSS